MNASIIGQFFPKIDGADLYPGYASLFFCTLIWDDNVPLKFSIFTWKLSNDFLALDTVRQKLGFT